MTTQHDTKVDASVTMIVRWRQQLAAPVDIAVLVYFRIAFGSVMVWETWRFIDHGWIDRYYTDKRLYFSYWPFSFVEPLPEPGIHLVFWSTMAAASMVTVGLFYRIAAPAMFVGLAYIFLLERARYLNHFYLIVLIAFLLCFLPLNRSTSIDAWRDRSRRSVTAPRWTLWLLRFQVAVPYFFGGIAKLNADWLRGEPLRAWLAARTDFPFLGRFFTNEPVMWAMTYGSLALDLFVVAGLLHWRTRPWAFLAAVVFHLMNSRLFGIGVFPWVMMSATAIFFDPAWPRRVVADLRHRGSDSRWRLAGLCAGGVVGSLLGGLLPDTFSIWRWSIAVVVVGVGGYHVGELVRVEGPSAAERVRRDRPMRHRSAKTARTAVSSPALALLGAWVGLQVVVPLRHFLIPSNVHWSEEGHDFAWHMKLRDKEADAAFVVVADGVRFEIDNDDYLTARQESKMSARPHLMLQYADFLEDEFEELGYEHVAVYADAWASLNGREFQQFIDPAVDLTIANIPWLGHAEWVLPLDPHEALPADDASQ